MEEINGAVFIKNNIY